MALKTYKFNTIDEMNCFLAGAVLGRELPLIVYDLVGTTAKFTKPTAATCTFVAGARTDGGLTFDEIKTQLEAAVGGLVVERVGRRIAFRASTSAGVAFAAGSTGLSLLGISNAASGLTVPYGPPSAAAAPRLVQAFGFGTQMAVIVEEA